MIRRFAGQAFPSKGRTAPGTTPPVEAVLASACPDGNHNHRTKMGYTTDVARSAHRRTGRIAREACRFVAISPAIAKDDFIMLRRSGLADLDYALDHCRAAAA